MPPTQRPCGHCGVAMHLRTQRDRERRRYCSRRCRQLARYVRGELTASLQAATDAARTTTKPRLPKGLVRCVHCDTEYRPRSARQKWCRTCVPDQQARARMRRYGLSQPQYDAMVIAQHGGCRLCGEAVTLYVDHDHACCPGEQTCGQCIRGLLCSKCNVKLAVLEQDPAWLAAAVRYLGGNHAVQK